MDATIPLVALAGVAVAWGIVAGLLVFDALRRRGEKVNFLLVRLLLPVWVHRYAELTRDESGRPGPLFYHYVVAFSVALAAAVAAALLRLL